MAAALDIGVAHLRARLAGRAEDAAPLERRLSEGLSRIVLPAVAERIGEGLPEGAIVCLPELSMRIRMTLAEALGGAGFAAWIDALAEAIARDMAGGEARVFADRWAYVWAYLLDRLGQRRAPRGTFEGFAALDLLSPAEAVAEALSAWPELWPQVAAEAPKAWGECLQRLEQTGGEAALWRVLAVALAGGRQPVRAGSDAAPGAGLAAALAGLDAGGVAGRVAAPAGALATPGKLARAVLAVFHAALRLGPVAAAELALALWLVTRARDGRADPERFGADAARADMPVALPSVIAGRMADLAQRLEAQPQTVAALRRLLAQGNATTGKSPETPARAEAPRQGAKEETAPEPASERTIRSPLAGIGLCLPFLLENRMGLAFPAALRHEALCLLAEDGPVARPEEDALLAALCGADEREDLPSRPSGFDLLFLPEGGAEMVMDADPGAARLAEWLRQRLRYTLPGMARASDAYLGRGFLHRPGTLTLTERRLSLVLEPMPLGPVLDLSGLPGPDKGRVPWLEDRTLSITQQRSAP